MRLLNGKQIYLFFFIISFIGCKSNREIDISDIELKIHIERFDIAMDSLTWSNMAQKNQRWQRQYGSFYLDYMDKMLQVGNPLDTSEFYKLLPRVLKNTDYNALKTSVYKKYLTLSNQEEELSVAFKHIKYYFPKAPIPRIISFFSGFAVQTPIGKDYIGIGLDMFLGKDSKFYPALIKSIPRYISQRFTPENIVPRVLETYLREELYAEKNIENSESLLSLMIYNGKIMYLMDSVLPFTADSLKIGYTSKQMIWAESNQKDIWAWFIDQDLIYSTDYQRFQKHLGEAPFTPELGNQSESAPKLAIYLGWQLVRKYMDENPEITLQQLLNQKSAQELLNESKYKGNFK